MLSVQLQQELQDMRRVAAQVAAERQAATPLPPIAPRPRKRCRSDVRHYWHHIACV